MSIAGTLPAIFRARSRDSAARVALREKRNGIWREHTWNDYWERARAFGLGLVAIGVRPGDRVAIHSEDRPEWLFADLGAQGVGALSVGIYSTNPAAEVQYVLAHSGARILVAEDQEQVDKALAAADRCPALERIVVIDRKGLRNYHDRRLMGYEELEALGRELHAREPERFDRLVDALAPDQVATIVYTSGTTGPPKGAMLTHANLAASVRVAALLWGASPEDRVCSYLPLCHVAEKIFTIYLPLASGASANFAESVDTVTMNLREVEPTVFLGVPRIWEKMAAGIFIRMQDADRLKRANFRLWMAVGKRLGEVWIRSGGRYPFPWNLLYRVGWLALYRSLQGKLGLARCRIPVSGAAPIAPDILRFFQAIGIHIREAWGQTECSGAGTLTPREDVRIGSVGVPIREVRVGIAADGEILLRSPLVFAGYYRDEEATRAAFDAEGWLRTGDVGFVDDHGHVHITDRKKDLIITAGGKNIAPSLIENSLKASPFVKEAIVVGDRRSYLAALIGIERDAVADWATRRGIAFTTYRDLTERPEVVDLVAAEVRRVNEDLSSVEQIKRFRLIPKELDHEDGELTATQKVKRGILQDRFRELVEALYTTAT
ncbi:MAG: AMP-binding protein [Candidatus Limnocylindria bacterium]|nr:AMP-binding protein [Candidatus Limnocylindria bacterium]